MRKQIVNSISDRVKSLQSETIGWLKEAYMYLDQIEAFQHLIHTKELPNRVGEQISRDVDLNLNTMADKILKDVVKPLQDHETLLESFTSTQIVSEKFYDDSHTALALKFKNLKIAVRDLNLQVQNFLLQKEFGVRASI
ncbi:MAG: hypothetical protein WA951_11235 [Leeuwenhoekiella sp.]